MSAQVMNERSRRRVERWVGQPVVRCWSHGGYWYGFVTADHRHGAVNKISQKIEWDENPTHYTSCRELFPVKESEPEGKPLDMGWFS